MTDEPTDIERPRRGPYLRATIVADVFARHPSSVTAALRGDRAALRALLRITADAAWQATAEAPRRVQGVEEVAASANRLADAVADHYSLDSPPPGSLCDLGFALAFQVEALVFEVLHRRAQAGQTDPPTLAQPDQPAALEARHLARAHLAELRDAARNRRVVTGPDVEAAEYLYRAVVDLCGQVARGSAAIALTDSSVRSSGEDAAASPAQAPGAD